MSVASPRVRKQVLRLASLFIVLPLPGMAAIYTCTFEDAVAWEAGKPFQRFPYQDAMMKQLPGFRFNDANGSLSFGPKYIHDLRFNILTAHNKDTDLVAIYQEAGVSADVRLVRIRAWEQEKEIRFMYFENREMWSGRCVLTP